MRHDGYEPQFIALADVINRGMPAHVVNMINEALNEVGRALKGAQILVLGVAYKRGVGDTRESPAYGVITGLRRRGAEVSYADPLVPVFRLDTTDLKALGPTNDALRNADCVVILTDHSEFDYQAVAGRARLIVDTRQVIPPAVRPGVRMVRL